MKYYTHATLEDRHGPKSILETKVILSRGPGMDDCDCREFANRGLAKVVYNRCKRAGLRCNTRDIGYNH